MVLLFVRDETIIPLEEKISPSLRKVLKFQEDLLFTFWFDDNTVFVIS